MVAVLTSMPQWTTSGAYSTSRLTSCHTSSVAYHCVIRTMIDDPQSMMLDGTLLYLVRRWSRKYFCSNFMAVDQTIFGSIFALYNICHMVRNYIN